jgi:hypothetical protein
VSSRRFDAGLGRRPSVDPFAVPSSLEADLRRSIVSSSRPQIIDQYETAEDIRACLACAKASHSGRARLRRDALRVRACVSWRTRTFQGQSFAGCADSVTMSCGPKKTSEGKLTTCSSSWHRTISASPSPAKRPLVNWPSTPGSIRALIVGVRVEHVAVHHQEPCRSGRRSAVRICPATPLGPRQSVVSDDALLHNNPLL